jgi:membrane protein insertase Oxa1/YidC/SpoIIIJ
MGMINLLANLPLFVPFGVSEVSAIDLNWLAVLIKGIIESIHITSLIDTGLGIICFTLILKTIVLPLDIYSRYQSKKQALVMKKMRPQMEKLQKQYANDKAMYSQKVNELYKKSGYSMFGACIPMVVSLVIFIFVFNAFSSYSRYANLELYRGMVQAYNGVVQEYVYDENTEIPSTYLGTDGFIYRWEEDGTEDSYTKPANNSAEYGKTESGELVDAKYSIDYDKFISYYDTHDVKLVNGEGENLNTSAELFAYYQSVGYSAEEYQKAAVQDYIKIPARAAAEAYFNENNRPFLWVGNIWYPDSMLNKKLPDYSGFYKAVNSSSVLANYDEAEYDEITYNLTGAKSQYNGYFVLIVLAIGLMFLQQFVMSRSQKDVSELSSVDGSAARTNKYMMIIMPIMYGIFSFFYSAAFSIYMITNTTYSLITTLIINKIMDVVFAKKEAKAELERYERKKPTDSLKKSKKK